MCKLTSSEVDPASKKVGSSGAPSFGDKGVRLHNMFEALGEDEREEGPPPMTDSEEEPEEASCRRNRWNRWRKVVAKRRSHRRAAQTPETVPCSDAGTVEGSVRSLVEISMSSLSGLNEETEEWEEIEFMVDSGAGTTVIGPEHARAVKASEPDPDANYKLADGSVIPNEGRKTFTALTEEWDLRSIRAAVTKVDTPLLSVSSCVLAGATVVFSPSGSYIETPDGKRQPLTASKGVYNLKLWIPKDQKNPFQGQA